MSFYTHLDDIDKMILFEVQRNSKITIAELAQRVNLSPPAIHARIKRLEEAGVIRQYAALLERTLLGFDVLCFIQVTLHAYDEASLTEFRHRILAMPEVMEGHLLIGDSVQFMLKVLVRNPAELQRFLLERLLPLPSIAQVKTGIVLEELKTTTVLPIMPFD